MKSASKSPEHTEVLHGPGRLVMNMCPCCGDLQITIPLEGTKRISVSVEHPKLLLMLAELLMMAEAYREGTLKTPAFLPIECCDGARRH